MQEVSTSQSCPPTQFTTNPQEIANSLWALATFANPVKDTKTKIIEEIRSKIFAGEEVIDRPSIPFRVIRYLSNEDTWGRFLKIVSEKLNLDDVGDVLLTSCVNTTLALSVLIEKDYRRMQKNLRRSTEFEIVTTLSSSKEYAVKFINLFDGPIIYDINGDFDQFQNLSHDQQVNVISNRYLPKHLNEYFQYSSPFIQEAKKCICEEESIASLNKFYEEKLDYSFNRSTITQLRKDLFETSDLTSEDLSWFYFIASMRHLNNTDEFEHGFVLEQHFCQKYQSTRTRIYQSWINQAKLSQDLKKRSYEPNGEGSMDDQQLEFFLNNIESHYCRKRNEVSTIGSKECFGYESIGGETPLLNFDGKVLSGLTIRYFSVPIDPEDCLENLAEFMMANKFDL